MAQDTLLGFPAHILPYRRGEFTVLSTVLFFYGVGHEKATACLLHSFCKTLPTLIMSAL